MARVPRGLWLALSLMACTPPPGGSTPATSTGGTRGSGGSVGPDATSGAGGAGSGGAAAGGSSTTAGSGGAGGATGGAGGNNATGGRPGPGGDDAAPLAADGAPADGAADFPEPAATCAPGALLCEDFEAYAVGGNLAPTWNTDVIGGTIGVDSSRPFRGGKGLHISAKASTPNLLQITKQGAPLFPVPGNTFYGRMMMWLTQMPTGEVHFNTVQANGLLPGSTRIAKYAYGAMYARLMAGYTIRTDEAALPSVDCGKSAATGYPEKKWVCVEWKFDGANNEMHTWLDGKAQTGVDVIKVGGGCVAAPPGGVWQAPVFNKLMVGWYAQPFNQPVEMWIDDLAVGSERLGCPTP
jgi:hypothetical protein